MLKNGTLLMESSDQESGDAFFYQLQSARQIMPDDLRTHDQQSKEHLTRFESRWSPVLSVTIPLFWVLLVVVGVGLLLAQFTSTEVVGGWMFWFGIPIGVVVYITMKVLVWRLESGIRRIQEEAGIVPGMVDEIEHPRGLELIETHGLAFTIDRG